MDFRLDPTFRSSIAGLSCSLAVTYLDVGTGAFRVTWGTGANEQADVPKTGGGRWSERRFDVPCDSFRGALDGGSDVAMTALGGEDTTFHMVEVRVSR